MKHGDATQLAKQINVTPACISSIFRGERRPSAELAILLEKATGIDRRAWLYPNEFPNPMIRRAESSTSAVNQ
jgi:plasmid maintenance system antidote protein VapI